MCGSAVPIPELVILTRDGFPNTRIMRERLGIALQSLGWATSFKIRLLDRQAG